MQERFIPCYEASVLRALEEVENVLVAYAKEQVRRDSLGRAAAAAQRAAAVAQDRYQAGLVDFKTCWTRNARSSSYRIKWIRAMVL